MVSTDIRFIPASSVPFSLVWKAFREGFRDYIVPVTIEEAPFQKMLEAEQIDLGASVVALDNTGEPLGLCLLAVRDSQSWCGGLGVVPALRRKGLGRELMLRTIDEARSRGLASLRLECIDGNDAARNLYLGLGFRVIRRLDVFDGAPASAPTHDDRGTRVWTMDDPTAVWDDFGAYHGVPRPWAHDEPTLRLTSATASTAGLATGDRARPEAYLVYRVPAQAGGRVAIVDTGCLATVRDEQAALTDLLAALIAAYPGERLSVVNVPENDPFNSVLRAVGVPVNLSQSEMELDLADGG